MIAVTDAIRWRGENVLQPLLAFEQGKLARILALRVEQVEQIILQRDRGILGRRLHLRERRRATLVQRHQLAIEHRVLQANRLDGLRNAPIFVGPVLRIAREQPRLAVLHHRNDATPIELDLVQPPIPLRRCIGELRQLGRHKLRRHPQPTFSLGLFYGGRLRSPLPLRRFFRRRLQVPRRIHLALLVGLSLGFDLLQRPFGLHAGRPFLDRVDIVLRPVVPLLDQQPVVAPRLLARPWLHPDKRKPALQSLAEKHELEVAILQHLPRVALRRPLAAIPQHHRAFAIARRDHAFEAAILDRVILYLDRQTLVSRIEARPTRHGPAFENAVQLQPEVEMQPCRVVLLHDKEMSLGLLHLAPRLGRRLEVAHRLVACKQVRHRLAGLLPLRRALGDLVRCGHSFGRSFLPRRPLA